MLWIIFVEFYDLPAHVSEMIKSFYLEIISIVYEFYK